MSVPLLATKFHIPHQHTNLVPRPHLIKRLNDGLQRNLILVSAPAGFGKTSAVVNWIETDLTKDYDGRVAWLSLDENDNEFSRFFTYFIAALQNIEFGLGEELRMALSASQNPQIEVLLTLLVNEIAAIDDKLILVLDDYHLISALAIHKALQFIIDNQPSNFLLVLTTRDEPFLPLSRLRARGQMIDLRAGELRFSRQEAAQYLNQQMKLGLAEDDILALETRTEGWITGLRLAALSLLDQDNPKSFITEFTGDDRYVIDYLVDEVFLHRSEKSRIFLQRTSILDRLTSPLCQAVTQQEDAQDSLQKLEQENVFIVPLDNRRKWYRYHHLFADVLRQRLTETTSAEEIENLHLRASQWYEENGSIVEAVEYAFKAKKYEEVIRLIDIGAEGMFLNSQLNTLLAWHNQIPHHLIDSHPKLCLIFAWAWVSTGKLEKAEHCLQAAEKTLGANLCNLIAAPEHNTIDVTAQGALLEIAVIRAQLAIGRGDFPEALKLANFALPHLTNDDGPYLYNPPAGSRMAAYFIRGLAQKLSGDLDSAAEAFVEAGALAKKLSHVHIVALAHGHLANLQTIQGQLHQALRTCQYGLSEVEQMAGENSPLSGFLRAEYGNLLYERNELESAKEYFREAIRVAKPWGFIDAFIPGFTGLAQIHTTYGDWQAAFDALNELEKLGRGNPQLVRSVVESQRALLWAKQGKLAQAHRWIEAVEFDPKADLLYCREAELIIFAQILLVQTRWDELKILIDRLLAATKESQRWGRVIKLLTLQAIQYLALGKQDKAVESFNQAIARASSEGHIRTFLDLGKPVEKLLRMSGPDSTDFREKLLTAFSSSIQSKAKMPADTLVDPLSERELEVLRLLYTELTGPEIAQELVIAVSTLRTHTQQIYRKLGVSNRRAALKAAEELQLL